MNDSKRFWSKVRKGPGCWVWLGRTEKGYGRFDVGGKSHVKAHRFAYEEAKGAVPAGLELDHRCETRACVRPSHLRAVTHRVNVLRSQNPCAKNARKTHCLNGHLLAGANLRMNPARHERICVTCARARGAAAYKRNRVKILAASAKRRREG